jgi:hypothetical protein
LGRFWQILATLGSFG